MRDVCLPRTNEPKIRTVIIPSRTFFSLLTALAAAGGEVIRPVRRVTQHRPATNASCPPAGLSRREVEVVCCVADGLSNKVIASSLYISEKTVETHLSHIKEKLGAASRTQIAAYAVRSGIHTIDMGLDEP